MRKLLALASTAALVLASTEAYATWDYLYDQCGNGYTYMKGAKSAWPAWAKQDGCVRPWSENPAAKKPEHVRARENNS